MASITIVLACNDLSDMLERVKFALTLPNNKFMVTGTPKECAVMSACIKFGRPKSIIIEEDESTTTIENMINCFELLDIQQVNCKVFDIVSAAYHINRIKYIVDYIGVSNPSNGLTLRYHPVPIANDAAKVANEAYIMNRLTAYNSVINSRLFRQVVLIRHGESESNAGNRTAIDPNITTKGKAQAAELTDTVDLVVHSGFKRTIQTLENSRIKYSAIIVDADCREHEEGTPCNYKEGQIVTTETLEEFRDRASRFIRKLMVWSRSYRKIVVISHGYFIRQLTSVSPKNCQKVLFNVKRV